MAEGKGKLIEKLNNRNYVPWAYRMKLYLKNEKCWEAIENNNPPNNITVANWKKMVETASFLIGAFLGRQSITVY